MSMFFVFFAFCFSKQVSYISEALVCDDNEVAVVSRNNAKNDYCPRFEGDMGEISANTTELEGPLCVCRFNHKRSYENETCIPTVDCRKFISI